MVGAVWFLGWEHGGGRRTALTLIPVVEGGKVVANRKVVEVDRRVGVIGCGADKRVG